MNDLTLDDLTFGAILLACLASLVIEVVVETTSTPASNAQSDVARSAATPVAPARLGDCDCITVTQAPAPAR